MFTRHAQTLRGENELKSTTAFCCLIACLVLSLSACGGGGSSENSASSTSAPSVATTPAVSADATQFAATVAPDAVAPSYQVRFTISNPSGVQIFYSYNYLGTAISSTNFSLPTSLSGVLSIALWQPALLGSGEYQDQVQIKFCLDQLCNNPIAGSPILIPITYTVTGNVVSSVTYTVSPAGPLQIEAADTSSTASTTINVHANELPPYGVYLKGKSDASGIVASGSWQKTPNVSGYGATLAINLIAPNVIGPGVYNDTITISICYDSACTKKAIGSPWTLPVGYTVTATEGVDYTASTVSVKASDIAWSSVRQKIYAVTTAFSGSYPSSLVEIDPTTAVITRSLSLGSGSSAELSVSDDGVYAYVGFLDQPRVQRIALNTMTLNLSINLPTDPAYGSTYPTYLLAVPGSSRSVVISLYTRANGLTDWDSRGVYIYDDAVKRPNTFFTPDAITQAMALSWGESSTTLYAYDANQQRLFTASASAMGLSQSNLVTGVTLWPNMYYLNGAIYADEGSVTNPVNGAKLASFLPLSSVSSPSIAFDSALNRAYFSYEESLVPAPLWTFAVYDLQNQKVRAKARISGCSASPGSIKGNEGRLLRWGASGLAFNCAEGLKIISGPFVTR